MPSVVRSILVLVASLVSLLAQSPIGAAFLVGDAPGGTDTAPAVACEGSTGRYLVVWSASPAGATAEVRGQLLSSSGALLGPQMVLATDAVLGTRPVVAGVRASGRFVVGWIVDFAGIARSRFVAVDAGTGAVSAATTLFVSAIPTVQLALGGDSRVGVLGVGYNVLVASRLQGTLGEAVHTSALHVGATGTPAVVTGAGGTLAGGYSYDHVALSEHGGSSGRWLVSFSRYVLGNNAIFNFVLNDQAMLCEPTGAFFPSTGSFPAAATRDGNEFAVALVESGSLNVHRLTFSGACGAGALTLGPVASVASGLLSDVQITHARDEFLVTWRARSSVAAPGRVHVLGVDPATCVACGVDESIELTVASQDQPAIAAQWSGSATASDEALVVWSNGTIRARRCEARGAGTVTSLGGSCGIPGFSDFATYSGTPVLGDSTFQVELVSPTSPVLALVVGFSAASIPCGPCTLVPSPDLVLPGVSPTPIPIPCDPNLVGAALFTQWLQFRPGGCPLLPGIGLSNSLQFTLGQ